MARLRVALVRYGVLRHLAEFVPRPGVRPLEGRKCIVATPRGLEIGRVVALVERPSGSDVGEGALLRMADREERLLGKAQRDRAANDLVRARRVLKDEEGLKLVALEHLFDGAAVWIHYAANRPVEIPILLRELEKVFELPVVLHQVGARRRARLAGGCGPCGRALCCATFLRKLDPVPIRMARLQGLDLSPERTAGRCGRLKCCLRYEQPAYEAGAEGLPRVGWRVRTRRVSGEVLAVDALRGKVLVRPEAGRPRTVFVQEIEERSAPARLPLAGEAEKAPKGWALLRDLWRRVRREEEDDSPS